MGADAGRILAPGEAGRVAGPQGPSSRQRCTGLQGSPLAMGPGSRRLPEFFVLVRQGSMGLRSGAVDPRGRRGRRRRYGGPAAGVAAGGRLRTADVLPYGRAAAVQPDGAAHVERGSARGQGNQWHGRGRRQPRRLRCVLPARHRSVPPADMDMRQLYNRCVLHARSYPFTLFAPTATSAGAAAPALLV